MKTKGPRSSNFIQLYRSAITGLLALTLLFTASMTTARDLALWNDGPTRQNIIAFVKAVIPHGLISRPVSEKNL